MEREPLVDALKPNRAQIFPNDFRVFIYLFILPRTGAPLKKWNGPKIGQRELAFTKKLIFLYLNSKTVRCFFFVVVVFLNQVKGIEMDVGILADSKYLSWHMLFSFSADKAITSACCCNEHDVRERPFFGLISQPCSRRLQHFVLFLRSLNLLLISVSPAQSSMYVPSFL